MEPLGQHLQRGFVAQRVHLGHVGEVFGQLLERPLRVLLGHGVGAEYIAARLVEQRLEELGIYPARRRHTVGFTEIADRAVRISAAESVDHTGRVGRVVQHHLHRDHLRRAVAQHLLRHAVGQCERQLAIAHARFRLGSHARIVVAAGRGRRLSLALDRRLFVLVGVGSLQAAARQRGEGKGEAQRAEDPVHATRTAAARKPFPD